MVVEIDSKQDQEDTNENADYIIDMGPGGGEDGGRVVAVGTLEQIKADADSITGKYL